VTGATFADLHVDHGEPLSPSCLAWPLKIQRRQPIFEIL
jgi:hypothetical protein